jgi:hypothetical protein
MEFVSLSNFKLSNLEIQAKRENLMACKLIMKSVQIKLRQALVTKP